LISAGVAGIAAFVSYLWLSRCPVELSVLRVEPSMIYFGERKGIQVTFRVQHSDKVFDYHILSFQASVAGRWMEFQGADGFPFSGFQGPLGSGMRPGTEPAERLVMPEGTALCRVQISYQTVSLKRQFIGNIGPGGRRWVAKSRWLREFWLQDLTWPSPQGPVPWEPQKTNTVEIIIPAATKV
jgi:hypothetical protein